MCRFHAQVWVLKQQVLKTSTINCQFLRLKVHVVLYESMKMATGLRSTYNDDRRLVLGWGFWVSETTR